MKKVNLALAGRKGFSLSFHIPDFGTKGSRTSELLRLISFTNFNLYYVFVFGLLLSFGVTKILTAYNSEASLFFFSILSVTIGLSLYVLTVVLGGFRKVIDPKGVIVVLVFALMTTTAAVMVSPSSSSNTFGTAAVKALSGLAIISYLGIYYLSNVLLKNFDVVKKAMYALFFSFVILFFYELAFEGQNFIVGPFLFLMPLYLYLIVRRSYMMTVYALLFLGQLYFLLKNELLSNQDVFLISFIYGVVSLIITLKFVYLKRSIVKEKLEVLKHETKALFNQKSKVSFNVRIKHFKVTLIGLAFLLSPVIFFGISIAMYVDDHDVTNTFDTAYNQFSDSFEFLKDSDKDANFETDDAKTLLTGMGADQTETIKIEYVSTIRSFVANVFVSQGLLGLFAYILLWSYGIYSGFKYLHSTLKGKVKDYSNVKFASSLLAVLIFIPLFSIFVYTGIVAMLIWWIVFSWVMVLDRTVKLSQTEEAEIVKYKIGKRDLGLYDLFVKYVLMLSVVVICCILVYSIFGERAQLI